MQKSNVQKTLAMLLAVAAIVVWRQPCVWAQEEKAADDNKQTSTEAQKAADDSQQLTELEKLALQKQGYNTIGILSSGADGGIMPLAFDPNSIYDGTNVNIGGSVSGNNTVAIGRDAFSDFYGVVIGSGATSYNGGVAIGFNARNHFEGVAIGYSAASDRGGVAIGDGGTSTAKNSVAIGSGSYVDKENTVSFGDVNKKNGILNGVDASNAITHRNVEGVDTLRLAGGISFGSGNVNKLEQGVIEGVKTINGVGIAKETDSGNIIVGGINLTDMKNTVDNMQSGGGASENTAGIVRENIDDSGTKGTTIETVTQFTAAGMTTTNIIAETAAIGGVSFEDNGVITNVKSINGISFENGKINGIDISSLNNRVTALENAAGGGANLDNVAGIERTENDGKYTTTIEDNTSFTESGMQNNSEIESDGNKLTNAFVTDALNGTTQTHTQTSADGKTEISTSVNTKYDGMTVTSSKTVTDGDGNKTTTTNSTAMTGGSISVNTETTYTEKDADGNETTKTANNNVTISNGDIKLDKVDASGNRETMYVGEEINNIKDDMREMGRSINKLGKEVDEVGALSAALAGLHPNPENANSRADLAMAIGSYDGEQAIAVGGFYRADKRTMFSVGASATSSKQMFNMGVSIALDKMPEAERREKEIKQAAVNNETLQAVVAALQELKADNEAIRYENDKMKVRYARMENDNAEMKARYEKLSADYEALKAKYEIQDVKAEEMVERAKAKESKKAKPSQQAAKRIAVIKQDKA